MKPVWGLVLLFFLSLQLAPALGDGDTDILIVVGSSIDVKSDSSVVQFFDILLLNTTTGVQITRAQMYQERNVAHSNFLSCTASDSHSHTLYFFASMPNTTSFGLYNVTSSHANGWNSNTTFALSDGLAQSFNAICQCTRYSGNPEQHGSNPNVWANVMRGPLYTIDVTSGDESVIADLDQQGQACCVQAVDLENLFFYSVHSFTLLTMDLSDGLQTEQPLSEGWYLLDIPLTQSKESPRIIVVRDGGGMVQLANVDALDVNSAIPLYDFGPQYWPMYPGLHRSLMTDDFYYVSLEDQTEASYTKYDIYIFDTTNYKLVSRFEVDFPLDTYLIGMT